MYVVGLAKPLQRKPWSFVDFVLRRRRLGRAEPHDFEWMAQSCAMMFFPVMLGAEKARHGSSLCRAQ